MDRDGSMLERRTTHRVKALNAGAVRVGFGRGIECTIRNISRGGACLVFSHRRTALPREFSLTVEPDSTRRVCRLVWQSAYRAGVRFVEGC
jgi:hypothetical protein